MKRPARPRRPGLDDKRYRDACKQLRVTGSHICARCGYPIDLQLEWRHPLSWSADHRIPRSQLHPDDIRNWHIDNLQEMHRRCNTSKGAKTEPHRHPAELQPSIDW